MKRIALFFILPVFTATILHAQPSPQTTDEILSAAYKEAARDNKYVFIMFHASWCVWCHRMDNSMNETALKKYFDDHFVIRHLVVDESKERQHEENPGADEFRKKYHGEEQGIPFWLILDKDGKLMADSKMRPAGAGLEDPGQNVGCPASEDEVSYFIGLLKKFTKLNDEQLEQIRKRFRENDQ